MPEETEYLPSRVAAEINGSKTGFYGFCMDIFEKDCKEGSNTCLDWERCYAKFNSEAPPAETHKNCRSCRHDGEAGASHDMDACYGCGLEAARLSNWKPRERPHMLRLNLKSMTLGGC